MEFPNEEVEYGFIDFLVPYYTSVSNNDQGFHVEKFVNELEAGDINAFLTRRQASFADLIKQIAEK